MKGKCHCLSFFLFLPGEKSNLERVDTFGLHCSCMICSKCAQMYLFIFAQQLNLLSVA